MYAIKMEEAKVLVTTIYASIYEGEKNADALVFLLPKTNGQVELSETSMFLRYIAPDGVGHSEALEMYPLPYSDTYYQYRLSIGSKLTAQAGTVELWLTALDTKDDVVLKTSSLMLEIKPAKSVEPYLPSESRDQLEQMEERIAKLAKEKADNLVYDEETRRLQLTAESARIGDSVVVPGDGYADDIKASMKDEVEDTWSDMDETEDDPSTGEDWEDM